MKGSKAPVEASGREIPAGVVAEAAAALCAWFSAYRRDLPWRREVSGADARNTLEDRAGGSEAYPSPRRNPYATWIAEIMLQQTQVGTVIGYFNRWMDRFPDVGALARAGEAEVLEAWAGLGYYSRARNILETARLVVSRHGGLFPWRKDDLLGLKGVGEYTAGAIASLAFDLPEPILDGNLVRVFSRTQGWDFLPDTRTGRQAYWELARAWAANPMPGLVNEGLMELGALVCTPRNPCCGECPLAKGCRARIEERQAQLPPPKARKATELFRGFALVAIRGYRVLLNRPSKPEVLAGLLTFPVFPSTSLPSLRQAWKETFPGTPMPSIRPRVATITHSITHRLFRLRIVEARWDSEQGPAEEWPEGYVWVPAAGLEARLVSSLPRKIWAGYGREGLAAVMPGGRMGRVQQRKPMAPLE